MIYLQPNQSNTIVVTWSQRATSSAALYYLLAVRKIETNVETVVVVPKNANQSVYERYDRFTISAQFSAGQYEYTAYEATGVTLDTAIAVVESGLMEVEMGESPSVNPGGTKVYAVYESPNVTVNPAPAPLIVTAAGTYAGFVEIEITSAGNVYYTTDGTTPSSQNGTLYDDNDRPVLTAPSLFQARAYIDGFTLGAVAAGYFVINPVTVTIEPAAGTYLLGTLDPINLVANSEGVDIYYTLDGSEPTESSTLFTGAISPFEFNTTIKWRGFKAPAEPSAIGEATFLIKNLAPVVSPDDGLFINEQLVAFSNFNTPDTGAELLVSFNGAPEVDLLDSAELITVNTNYTARIVSDNRLDSDTVSGFIEIKMPNPDVLPSSGTYISEVEIDVFFDPLIDQQLYYRTDGVTPTPADTEFTGGTIFLTQTSQFRIRAFRAGATPSDVIGADYVIKCAAPSISPNGGAISAAATVTLATSTIGASIRYTTDGSEPTASSTLYSTPFALGGTGSRTVKAKAFKAGTEASETTTSVFQIVDEDVAAFLQAAGITDPTQESAINTLVLGLKADETWAKLRAIYPVIGGTGDAHKWNLKDPRDLDAAFRLSFLGGWTHNASGMQANGTTGYARTFFSNDIFNTSTGMSGGVQLATSRDFNAGTNFRAYLAFTTTFALQAAGTVQQWRAGMQADSLDLGTSGSNIGLWALSFRRSNSTDTFVRMRPDGTQGISNSTVNSITAGELFLSARNASGTPDGFAGERITFAFMGEYLTPTDLTNIRTRILAYQTAIGR